MLVGDYGEISALTASADIDIERSTNDPEIVDIAVYADFLCPFCAQFELANRSQSMQWVTDGTVRLEYHPIAFLDRFSRGSNYSTRTANAAACIANETPEAIPAFNDLLFANQPQEGSEGLTDTQLTHYAQQAGAPMRGVRDRRRRKWRHSCSLRVKGARAARRLWSE